MSEIKCSLSKDLMCSRYVSEVYKYTKSNIIFVSVFDVSCIADCTVRPTPRQSVMVSE